MKKTVGKYCVWVVVVAVACFFAVPNGDAADAQKKEKGQALQQLEGAAGKKIEDVKVPDAPQPTPAGNNQAGTSSQSPQKKK